MGPNSHSTKKEFDGDYRRWSLWAPHAVALTALPFTLSELRPSDLTNNPRQTLPGSKRERQEGRPEAAEVIAFAPRLQFSEECLPIQWPCAYMSLDLQCFVWQVTVHSVSSFLSAWETGPGTEEGCRHWCTQLLARPQSACGEEHKQQAREDVAFPT